MYFTFVVAVAVIIIILFVCSSVRQRKRVIFLLWRTQINRHGNYWIIKFDILLEFIHWTVTVKFRPNAEHRRFIVFDVRLYPDGSIIAVSRTVLRWFYIYLLYTTIPYYYKYYNDIYKFRCTYWNLLWSLNFLRNSIRIVSRSYFGINHFICIKNLHF